jgi:peptidyl-prolyl cis-trans isomerase D
MAVIQKIRNQYGKIAGAVIAVSLISFIISDALNGSFGNFFGGRDTYVASVDGTKIESKDFEMRVKEYELLTTIYNNRAPIDDAARAQIREQVLNSMTYEVLAEKACEKLGINTSEQERKDLIYGMNAHPLVRQYNIEGNQVFNNEQTKQFDPTRVKGLEDELAKNGAKIDPYNKIGESWAAVKAYVIRMSKFDKFNNMVGNAIYEPRYLATRTTADQDMRAAVRFVKVPFTAIPDNEVKTTDADLQSFVDKHKGMFDVEQELRSLDYISFDIIPASADSARAFEALAEIKTEFSTAKDIETYVGNKTDDINTYSKMYFSKKTLQSMYVDTFLAMPTGTVFGPYFENGSFKISRIEDKKPMPDSVKVRHILIVTKSREQMVIEDSVGKRRIDSIVAAIRGGASFDSLLTKSDDQQTKVNKGEFWITPAQRPAYDTAFGDYVFEAGVNSNNIIKAANPGYSGYHYVEVLERKNVEPMVKLATISKSLSPSDSTVNAIYAKATDFAATATNAAEFDAQAKKLGYDKRVAENVKENSFSIQGIGTTREVIKWAFESKLNDVSNTPFKINDERYVVCRVANVIEKNKFVINASNKMMLEQRVKEDKKAELIANKYKGSALEAIAQATSQQVQQTDSVSLGAPYVPGIGYEPKLVGYTFNNAFAPNAVSPGIKGQGGVYFISLVNRMQTPPNPMEQQNRVMQNRFNQEQQLKNYVGQVLQASLMKNAVVKYKLANF